MTKIEVQPTPEQHPVLLDTLAQPLLEVPKALLSEAYTPNQLTLQKRARSKAISDAFVFPLIDVKSSLEQSYWQTWRCTRVVLQDGDQLKARYCNQRWCMVCNRIRSATLRNGYEPAIDALKDPQFVTLTHRTVSARHLRSTIETDLKTFNLCKRVMAKEGIKIKGLRKAEVEYNEADNKFHAHLHLIIEDQAAANRLRELWLRKHPLKTDEAAQKVKPATDSRELFKYFTKMLTKTQDGDQIRFDPKAMDIVFRAMKGKRVFQPFGGLTKAVSEDVAAETTTNIDWRPIPLEGSEIWHYEYAGKHTDWFNAYGEPLSENGSHVMDNDTLNFISKINKTSEDSRKTPI